MAEIPVPSGGAGYSSSGDRPLGVTILAIFQFLGGLSMIFLGSLMFLVPFIGMILGMVFVLLGLFYFVVGYGLFSMKSWAWIWAIITNVLGLILNLFQLPLSMLSIVINLIVILYLNQSDIKSRFR